MLMRSLLLLLMFAFQNELAKKQRSLSGLRFFLVHFLQSG